MDSVRARKQALIADELAQQQLLESELAEKNEILIALKNDEQRLRSEFTFQLGQKEELDMAIGEIIRLANRSTEASRERASEATSSKPKPIATEEVRAPERQEAKAPKPAPTTSSTYSAALSSDFSKNRGNLPLPVENGFVSKPFGTRAHPTLSKVMVKNNGVDIRTDPGASVKAIFEGEVVGLQKVPGYNTMIILQHGSYYTVYSNLVNVRVKQGARVGTADILGTVAYNEESAVSELHFEVWRDRVTQDPTRWVKGLK